MTIPKNINPLYIYFKLIPIITTEINSELLYRVCIPDHISADIPVPNLFTLENYYLCSYHVFQYNEDAKQIQKFMHELQDSVLQFLIHPTEENEQNKHYIHEFKTVLF